MLLVLLSGSCTQSTPAPTPTGSGTGPVASGAAVRFLALGDSYTIGQGVPAEDRWIVQLARLGQADGVQMPDIIAQTGWTTGELQQAIAAASNTKTYDLVSLMIGVNNQFRGLPLATYRTEFRDLLRTAIRFAGNRPGRVVVLSIPDWGQSPTGQRYDPGRISREIDQFNAAAQGECTAAGVAFLNITDLTRAAANDPRQFAPDQLHYSGAHMQQWASRALPVVRSLLQ
ncbi:SGNH/GDSL hydrolase family protein [Hymenobacter weizhouensis]|uniref:SGNH/GDSL hydrolase family protein n=1 Tax=Hymenobacter sp. YIM 151500-1 TaxID=2987689 RepID=UPI0022268769|nr:SGNH/GDSL hydrolase family protein [Hymenobacter sp. YIM 151500-1]UYZ62777.1 SGNH/GDSL hydrolase family protein [Hymenobacter sp. YIM 151500-1]